MTRGDITQYARHAALRLTTALVLATVVSGAHARAPSVDLEQLVAEHCDQRGRYSPDAEQEQGVAEATVLVAQSRRGYLSAFERYVNMGNVIAAYAAGDDAYFRNATCLSQIFVKADVGRDRIHHLIVAAIALVSQEQPCPDAEFPKPLTSGLTHSELNALRDHRRRLHLLEEFASQAIEGFDGTGDCRLVDDLVAMIGYSFDADSATLKYINSTCTGDRPLAERVYDAVFGIPWNMRRSLPWKAALQLVSAAQITTRYLTPIERIRRLWYAPFVVHDRHRYGRGLVERERNELDIVLRHADVHIAAMAELFDDMELDVLRNEERDVTQSIETQGMLAMIEQMPIERTRMLLAEWYARISEEAPLGSQVDYLRPRILRILEAQCVPQLAAWLVSYLPQVERTGHRGRESDARGDVVNGVRYLAMCANAMPEVREWAARLASEHPGTYLRENLVGTFGPELGNHERPRSPSKE